MRRRSLAPLVALVIASQACSQEPSAADSAPDAHVADARERAVEARLSLAALLLSRYDVLQQLIGTR